MKRISCKHLDFYFKKACNSQDLIFKGSSHEEYLTCLNT